MSGKSGKFFETRILRQKNHGNPIFVGWGGGKFALPLEDLFSNSVGRNIMAMKVLDSLLLLIVQLLERFLKIF